MVGFGRRPVLGSASVTGVLSAVFISYGTTYMFPQNLSIGVLKIILASENRPCRGQRSWFRIFQGALFLTGAAARVPPFAFVLLRKTAEIGSETGEKKRLVFPRSPGRFRLQSSRQPRAHRALLSCPLLSLAFECASAHGGFPPRW